MPDRKKVINGLECCLSSKYPPCGECGYDGDMKYNDPWSCRLSLMADALALLKAQQPRVMTLEEVLSLSEGDVVWFEEIDNGERSYVQPMMSDGKGFLRGLSLDVRVGLLHQGNRRFWSFRPTDEQRRAEPWNDLRI